MHTARIIVLLALLLSVSAGPARAALNQHLITGEPILYGVDQFSGRLMDRDTLGQGAAALSIIPHKNEIIAITVDSIFLGPVKEWRHVGPHVLVYAQVFDDGTDNPDTAYSRVLYNEMNQPGWTQLGLSDRILYGPALFKGHPIRIKLTIVELDKAQKRLVSKLLQATGEVASMANPEAATAVNVVVNLAKAINELNEDDFELRYDMTLYPQGPIGTVTRAGDSDIPFVGRAALRNGPYVILKRELEKRVARNREPGLNLTATTSHFDFVQPIVNTFLLPDNRTLKADSRVVVQGGYLHWMIEKLDVENPVTNPQVKYTTMPDSTISQIDTEETRLAVDTRMPYTDRTHAVINVTTGLKEGIDPSTMRGISDRDVAVITQALDNPDQLPAGERIGSSVDALASAIKAHIAVRNAASQAARRSDRDDTFRRSVEYPLYWSRQIRTAGLKEGAGEIQRNDDIAYNTVILDTLNDLIVNLPADLNPGNLAQMEAVSALASGDFEAPNTDTIISMLREIQEREDANNAAPENTTPQDSNLLAELRRLVSTARSTAGQFRLNTAAVEKLSTAQPPNVVDPA